MSLRVLHLACDGASARAAAAIRALEPAVGASSQLIEADPQVPPSLESACRAAARSFWRTLPTEQADLVVAHGWASVPAAERASARRCAALLVVAGPAAPGAEAELAAWASALTARFLQPAELVGLDGAGLRAVYAGAVGVGRHDPQASASRGPHDVLVRAEGLPLEVVDALLVQHESLAVAKGATRDEWRSLSSRSRVAVLSQEAPELRGIATDALAGGCLPVVLGHSAADSTLVGVEAHELQEALARWLADPPGLARRVALCRAATPAHFFPPVVSPSPAPPTLRGPARPLRVVLNHGGLVADELRDSLAPFGWELRPLLGPYRDPLPAADLLVVFPYGDPRGALDAIRRARRAGVPAAFWNVEDPRYFFDPVLGPLVRAAAREASATFSTTSQLAHEYAAEGVTLRYLPNYGRGFFRIEAPLPDEERQTDVLFLGSLTPARCEFLEAYRAQLGPEVRVVVRDDLRDPVALREQVSRSRLGLAVGTMTDAVTPSGLVRGEGLTERLFDYPLAGTPVLCDARRHLAGTFEDGEDLVVFDGVTAAVELTRSLLEDPDGRAALALSARRKVLAGHLGRHRLLAIVEALAGLAGGPALADAAVTAREQLAGGVA